MPPARDLYQIRLAYCFPSPKFLAQSSLIANGLRIPTELTVIQLISRVAKSMKTREPLNNITKTKAIKHQATVNHVDFPIVVKHGAMTEFVGIKLLLQG